MHAVLLLILLALAGLFLLKRREHPAVTLDRIIRLVIAVTIGVFCGYVVMWLCHVSLLAVLLGLLAFLLSLRNLFDLRLR